MWSQQIFRCGPFLTKRAALFRHVQSGCFVNSVQWSSQWNGEVVPDPAQGSYINVPGEKPLLSLTVGQLVDTTASSYGDQEAVVACKPTLIKKSYTQVRTEMDNLAAAFLSLGMQKGDRVGIWGPNSYQWYITQLAAMKAGLILVNINPAYTHRELLYSLNKVSIKGIVISEPFKTSNYYKMICQAVPELPGSKPNKLSSSAAPSLQSVISIPQTELSGTIQFDELMNAGSKTDAQEMLQKANKKISFDDPCNIQFTSGTTGNPKGVVLTHHNVVNNSYLVQKRFSYSSKDRLCVTVPLFHCYGGVIGALASLHSGAACVFPGPGFSATDSLSAASSQRCTVMYGTPTMHIDMLNAPDFNKYDLSSLQLATTAGAICPEELIREMKKKYGVKAVASLYGLTETSPVVFQNLPSDTDEQRSITVGYPQEHIEVKVCDQNGLPVPIGKEGEICIRGFAVMQGYWNDVEKTRESIDNNRWFHTGDLFVMQESGHGRIVGRLKDMIIRGGENVYPREIEDFLHMNPKIQEAHVFGIPDKRLGEEVAAWISLKNGHTMTVKELQESFKGEMAHYKVPRVVKFTNDFPKTVSGKIQKFKMRDIMVQELKLS